MDPRERADATLARARARGAYVVTPESAISPMDATSTQQIPRSLVSAIDRGDPEATLVVPANAFRGGRHHAVPAQGEAMDDRPAIAQEASTQMLPSPSRPQDQGPMSWAPPSPPAPPEPEELDGLIPTTKQPPTTRSSLSQRLDG